MKRIIGLCAIAALAACNSNNDAAIPAQADNGKLFPIGNEVPVTVNVMSSDRQPGNTVEVSREQASVTLNSIDLTTGAFDVTISLPDGTSVNLTEMTQTNGLINDPRLQAFELITDEGDIVQVGFGFDLRPDVAGDPPEAPSTDNAIFSVARVNLDEEGDDLQGFNTYLAVGDETETLPSGWATYSGATIATVYQNGDLIDSDFIGNAYIGADFENSVVDVELDGYYDGNGSVYAYVVVGEDLPVDGSTYGGTLGIANFGYDVSEFTISECYKCDPHTSVDLDGDVLGAFFGEDAIATAGVFGAEETEHEQVFNDADVEITGAFAAYADNAPR